MSTANLAAKAGAGFAEWKKDAAQNPGLQIVLPGKNTKNGKFRNGGVLKMGFWDKLTGKASSEQQNEEDLLMSQQEEVRIYTLSTCSHCRAAKKFLNSRNVEYSFTDVDLLQGSERESVIEEVKRYNPRCTFPTIIIGDKVIVGFKEDEIKEALNL